MFIFLVYIVQLFYNARSKKQTCIISVFLVDCCLDAVATNV